MERLPPAVLMVCTMLAAGLALIAASLLQTSERFWYWKQARQVQQGEIVSSEGVLRVGQTLTFACPPKSPTNTASETPIHNSTTSGMENRALMPHTRSVPGNNMSSVRGVVGRVVEQQRGLLIFALEAEETTPFRTPNAALFAPRVGDTLTLLATGAGEMYRFEAKARAVAPDPNAPNRMLVTVKLPFWLARIQRRQYMRAPVQTGATMRAVVSFDKPDDTCSEAVRCALLDLSGGGLRMEVANVHSPHAIARLYDCLPSGSVVDIDLDLPLLRGSVVRARIQSCQRVAARGGLALSLRGEFIQLPSWQQEVIISHVFQA
jgi:c-di-GMP-binding flagellar brake protein YcgR